ncbi:MAG: transcription-repair coupling factor [Bacilli bacterium]|nr:transcription-repair coupling factor [Bacilli bacterium]
MIPLTKDILSLVKKSNAYTSLLSKKGDFVVDDIIGISLLFSALYQDKKGNYLIVATNLYNAQKIADSIASFIGDDNVLLFPSDDILRLDLLSSSKEFLSQRIYVLNELLKNKKKVVVTHLTSLITPLPSKVEYKDSIINLKVGDQIDPESLKEKLVKSGYLRVNKVDQTFEFASRGDIIDIFSVNYPHPIRIEFFGDEIDSIRFFDIATQSSDTKVEEVEILPATDALIKDDEIEKFRQNLSEQVRKDREFLSDEKGDELARQSQLDFENISERKFTPRIYKYYRYIKNTINSLTNYIDADITFIANKKQFDATYEFVSNEAREYLSEASSKGKIISHLELYLDLKSVLKNEKCLLHANEFKIGYNDVVFNTHPIVYSNANISDLKIIIDSYLSTSEKLLLSVSNKKQLETLENLLKENKYEYEVSDSLTIPNTKIGISLFPLEEGFELPDEKVTVISSKELFGYQNKSSRFMSHFKEAIIIKNYDDLKPGDFVVHEYYGIGKFLEVQTTEISGVHRDFLRIQYAGSDVLSVPLSQFRLVRKYAGREGAEPKLSHLNGTSWEKTKSRIKERVNLLADRLYQLYSERAHIKGHAFSCDDEFQTQFENEFPYELTKDQQVSLAEIKKDMESEYVMDRLLCGDVGFGKTEVAFRAAFKAILDGKQVAILCPTTLLARQHYENAVERFRNFDVNVAVISRLIPEKKQKEYIKDIKSGKVHLVIGTHRLLSKDFEFKDLGLLIVDEEQRFGVEQKELIKELKSNVDVLSLSATPIPRTLQMSLIGVRPVSQINTPPTSRSTIQTYVAPYQSDIVRELIERELARKGQVFYVHNVVSTIAATANKLQRQIPNATVGVVHGKMEKDEIEDVMMRFYAGEIDVLVATSIIENGIDVPNANLIIVEDADHFGLAQLYQIKGRVGRGDRIAYAYLFYREQKSLSAIAEKRLKAIQDFAELGSGYKISQRDLMIRGAGDILGPEQAGFIDTVGLDLYLKMLNEVMEERKTGQPVTPPQPVKIFKIDAYIPDGYASVEDKIELYQKIENASSLSDLNEIKKHIRDVHGRLPDEVILLIKKRRLDILLEGEEFSGVKEYPDSIEVTLSKKFSNIEGIGNMLFEALSSMLDKIKVTYLQKTLRIRVLKKDNWLLSLETLVDTVVELYKRFSKRK